MVSWNEEKKRGLIEEKGELNAAFNETGWQGPQPPLYGILVEFIAVPHAGLNLAVCSPDESG